MSNNNLKKEMQFVNAIVNKDFTVAKQAFKEMFHQKSMDRMAEKKIQIAQSLYSESLDEDFEDLDEGVKTDRYVRAHGKKPSASGTNWAFTTKKMGDPSDDEMVMVRGKMKDAAKEAAEKLGVKVNDLYVMEQVDELDEAITASEYEVDYEESQFGGYTPIVKHKKTGKIMYSGQDSYKKPGHAEGHAEAYLDGYAEGGDRYGSKMANAYRKMHKKDLYVKEDLDEGIVSSVAKSVGKAIKSRVTTSGRADRAEKKVAKDEKKIKDKERLKKAKERMKELKNKKRNANEEVEFQQLASFLESALLESHFDVGDKVECTASGMKGKVIKVDPKEEGKYYTVKREDGKEMKYAPDELKAVG